MLRGSGRAEGRKKKGTKKHKRNIKALEPETFVRASGLRVRFMARRRLVAAAEQDRRFHAGESSGNKGATLTAFETSDGSAGSTWLQCVSEGVLGVWVGPHHEKKERLNALPRFCIFSLLGLTCLAWKLAFRENKSRCGPLKVSA